MGIFTDNLFTYYRTRLQFRSKIMGGTPMDPKIIEGWLKSKAGIDEVEELRRATIRTLSELGHEVDPDTTVEALKAAAEQLASTKQTNGFKRDAQGIYIEGRIVKAMMKECTNILFAGQKWGKREKGDAEGAYAGKGPKSFLAERVFVSPERIYLGGSEPTGVDLFIGHTVGPKGPQSNLTYYEYVERAEIGFFVKVAKDMIPHAAWPDLWVLAEENGLGSLRSQEHGKFDVLEWTPIKPDEYNRMVAAGTVPVPGRANGAVPVLVK